MIKLIAFDLDNVLIDGEAIDEIGKLMSVEAEISEITKKAMEGNLDFETALNERVALLKVSRWKILRKSFQKFPSWKGLKKLLQNSKREDIKLQP